MSRITRRAYAEMYGPTTGDRIRLGDTDLWILVEADRTIYGDEVTFGGGKVIRDGMGQSQAGDDETVDTVITNALILDHWGIVKADIGIKHGRILKIGKAGNPDTQPGVDIVIGACTEVIAGEGHTELVIQDVTPRPKPAEPISNEDSWRRAGRRPDGRPFDITELK